MVTRLFFTLFAMAIVAVATANCSAQSLWRHRDPRRVNMYYDSKARNVGDVLTIVIRETTGVDNSDQRTGAKSASANATFGVTGGSSNGATSGSISGNGNLTTNAARNFNGNSNFSVARQFTDRMTIMVLDVMPNGNLVVGGKRRRVVAGEERTLIVSGVVRPLDIAIDNTVESQYIANFRIDYEGVGSDSNFTTRRWFPDVIQSIWGR